MESHQKEIWELLYRKLFAERGKLVQEIILSYVYHKIQLNKDSQINLK